MPQSVELTGRFVGRAWRHPAVGMPGLWTVIAVGGLVDAVWAAAVHTTFSGVVPCVAILAILMATAAVYRGSGRSATIADGVEAIALWFAFAGVGCALSYLAFRSGRPLVDASYAAADLKLGFVWPEWNAQVGRHPLVGLVLALCYDSLMPQAGMVALLGFFGHGARVREFFWVAALSMGVTILIAGLFPAGSAPVFFGIRPQADYYLDILALRSDGAVTFALSHMNGIVSFPSYHAALGLAYVWAFRNFGLLTWGVIVLNTAMIISTVVPGGHYLVDPIAGIALAAAAIMITRRLLPPVVPPGESPMLRLPASGQGPTPTSAHFSPVLPMRLSRAPGIRRFGIRFALD
jgi:hypothetical protein